MPFNYQFDATSIPPVQGGGGHPPGVFQAYVSNTEIKPTKDGQGGIFSVEFTTEQGKITNNYNLWNNSQKAVEIAHKELSALSHATGVFKLDMNNDGAALRGAKLKIEVAKQANNDYMEVKKVLDPNGNEPGKPAQQPQQPGNTPPNNTAGWGAQQTQTPPAQPAGWQPQQPGNTPPAAPWGQQADTKQAPWGNR